LPIFFTILAARLDLPLRCLQQKTVAISRDGRVGFEGLGWERQSGKPADQLNREVSLA
jgi:hypothetical protein